MAYEYPLVVFSHLRWDFVFQRPQHLLTRLAKTRKVLFIEEPVSGDGAAGWEGRSTGQGVTVFRPRLPGPVRGFSEDRGPELLGLMEELREGEHLEEGIAWLYTPMALPLARAIAPTVVVYDCMDELSLFHGAPPELIQREAELLAAADLVFTGGPSLYRAKKDRHPSVHCFPSSVDARHFQRARPGSTDVAEPEEQRGLGTPRLGFYGVLDERLDLALLDQVARSRPDWEIVLVGPVVKIDPASLPRHPNLHYVGQRGYDELPGFLSGWDVCLLPFALNDATRFISPTKTLEYMAAERPIVSTPIRDVADPFGDTVFLGATPDAFIAGVERALGLSREDRQQLVQRMRTVIAGTSWESTASQMDLLVNQALVRKMAGARTLRNAPPPAAPARRVGVKA